MLARTSRTFASAIFAWNEFLFAAILTADHVRTVAITGFSTSMGIRWERLHGDGNGAHHPDLHPNDAAQRHLARGLTFGAVK